MTLKKIKDYLANRKVEKEKRRKARKLATYKRHEKNSLINRITKCKDELNKWNDIPISWQLENLCTIWEGKKCIGSNGRPQVMHKSFAINIQMVNNNAEAIMEFAKSLPEWKIIEETTIK